MSAPDNGGWDVAVEVATNALSGMIGSFLSPQLPQRPVGSPLFQGTVTPQTQITGVALTSAGDLTVAISIDGTELQVTNLVVPIPNVTNPPPPWLRTITIRGVIRVTDRLEMRSNALVIDFTPTPVLNQPDIAVEINEDSVLAAPLVQIALAYAFSLGGQAGFEQAKANLLQTIQAGVASAARAAVVNLGVVTIVPAPTLPFAITASGFLAAPASLHVLYAMGPAGNTSLITRSMLLTSSITGMPVDAAAISLGNVSLLRDFVAATLTGPPLGLPTTLFIPGHPCLFIGPVTIPPPGGPVPGITRVTLDSLIAGIDEAGLLHIVTRLTATGTMGTFTVSALVDNSFRFAATSRGGTLTLTVTPIVPSAVTSDVSIPWWMYVAGAVVGGMTLVGVEVAIDSFGGQLINGAIGTTIAGVLPTITAPVPLPGRTPALTPRALTSTQPDSARRLVTFAPGITIPDPFRSHDLIVNLV